MKPLVRGADLPTNAVDHVRHVGHVPATTAAAHTPRALSASALAATPVHGVCDYQRARSPWPGRTYPFSRRFESAVPMESKVVTIWLDDVSKKNWLGSLAQF